MRNDSSNLYLAIGLSLLVIVGWQYFYSGPKMEKARLTQIETQNQTRATNSSAETANNSETPVPAPNPNAPPQGGIANENPAARLSRAEALAATPRVKIDTPSL